MAAMLSSSLNMQGKTLNELEQILNAYPTEDTTMEVARELIVRCRAAGATGRHITAEASEAISQQDIQ